MRAVLGTDAPGVIPGRPVPPRDLRASAGGPEGDPQSAAGWRARLQTAMTRGAGVRREATSLAGALAVCRQAQAAAGAEIGTEWAEVRNLADVASAIVVAAWARQETRGAHTREDFPATDPLLRSRFLHGP